ncbi:MAG TPA: protein translocase subunit SecF [Candidatus Paceibacterota bacterium]
MFIIKHKKIFLAISAVLVLVSIILLSTLGLRLSIDFKGGALAEVSYPNGRPESAQISEALKLNNIGEVIVQVTGDKGYIIKTKDLTEAERIALFKALSLGGSYQVEEKSFNSIGPSIGTELRRKAIVSLSAVILAIILFIAYAFRKVSKPVSSWKYGIIAIVTLLHDVAIPIGLFTILSYYSHVEVDTLFVVAVLTILGLSVSDTIVVFDRVRENIKNRLSDDFKETVGRSLEQVYTRSINTSLTVILVLLSLFFFGPQSTKYFALMLSAGMFFGTYSSIFLASPLLVLVQEWQDRKSGKFIK